MVFVEKSKMAENDNISAYFHCRLDNLGHLCKPDEPGS